MDYFSEMGKLMEENPTNKEVKRICIKCSGDSLIHQVEEVIKIINT